jgi:PST family polysaccharide transporter
MQVTGQEKRKLMSATIQSTFWIYAATYSGKTLVFLSTVILARLLTEADFGLAGYALLVIGFLDVLHDLGVGKALIYYEDTPRTRDTAFWISLVVGAGLFLIVWAGAPLVGAYFNDMRSVPMVRAMALTFPLTAISNVHNALLSKNLDFKRKFVPDLVRSTSKGFVSIALAFMGYGAWSLVWGQVVGTAISIFAYFLVLPWKPSFRFDKSMFRPLMDFGLNVVAVDGLGVIFTNVDYLLVGRYLGAASLGVYSIAFRVPELLVKTLVNNVSTVLFPAFSKIREDTETLKSTFLIAMRAVTMATVPVAMGLAAVSRPLTLVLFTEKWAEAIPVMAAISIYTMIRSWTFNIGAVYRAQGRPEILTKLTTVKLVVLIPSLWWAVAVAGSINAVGWVQVANAVFAGILNMIVAARVLRLPASRVMGAIWPATLSGLIMTAAVLGVIYLLSSYTPLVQLIAGVAVGAVVYSAGLWWLERDFVIKNGRKVFSLLIRRKSYGGLIDV